MVLYRPKIAGKWASKSWFGSKSEAVDFVNATRGYNQNNLEIIASVAKTARTRMKRIW